MIYQKPQSVLTPIGKGVVEHRWMLHGTRPRALVRIQVDDTTRRHMADDNCITPTNEIYGLFVFDAVECQRIADL